MEQFGIINFNVFILAGILLNITPGSDTFYILARSIGQGQRAGVFSALGISTGALFHTIAAAGGLSVLLAQSATAFLLVKYLGALYLIYLGITTITQKSTGGNDIHHNGRYPSLFSVYLSGIITNVLNPKVALFFLAFLPQFIDQGNAHSMMGFFLLGITFVTTGTIWCLILALFASTLSGKLTQSGLFQPLLNKLAGGVFVVLGVKLALVER